MFGNRPDDGTGFCSRRRHVVTRIVGLDRSKFELFFFRKKTSQAIEGSGFLGKVIFFTDCTMDRSPFFTTIWDSRKVTP